MPERQLPRQIKISDKLAAMLKTLPMQGEKVWEQHLHQIRSNFNNQRNESLQTLQPETGEIHFHSSDTGSHMDTIRQKTYYE